MNSRIKTGFATAFLGLTLALSACTPSALQTQRGALVNVAAQPAGPGLARSSVDSETYRAPGPSALAVRTDHNAFVTVILLPRQWESLNAETPGAVVLDSVNVQAGVPSEIGVPTSPGTTQAFVVVSVQPMNLGAASGLTTSKAVAQVVEKAARNLPAGGYNVTTVRYQVKPFGTLVVDANISGARVSVNGREVGTTPFVQVRDVPAGSVEVKVRREGWQPWTRPISIAPDTVNTVYADLRRAHGVLTVQSSVTANVYVQGNAVGRVNAGSSLNVRLPGGRVSVSVNPIAVSGQPALNSAGTTVLLTPGESSLVTCTGTTSFTCTASP